MLNNKIEKKNQLKKDKKKTLKQPKLTCQTCDSIYDTEITQ